MATTTSPVRIEGLRELERAFKLYGRGMEKGVREALEAAGQPVATDAQSLAVASIPRIGTPWSRMRVGVTRRTAYVAPEVRRSRRPATARQAIGLKDVLLGRAMEPALERNVPNVEREIGDALNDLARMWSRV